MKSIILGYFSVFLAVGAIAQASDLRINVDQVKVYSQPNANSSVMTTLQKNTVVKASNKPPPGFQKVLVNGKDIGYILNSDLLGKSTANPAPSPGTQKPVTPPGGTAVATKKAMAASRPGVKKRKVVVGRGLSRKMSVSVQAGMDYQSQGSRSYTAPDGALANISALTGMSTLFGVQFQFPISQKISVKTYVQMKTVSVSGSSTYQTNPAVTAAPSDTFLKESFLVIGAMGQYYFGPYFWAGAGMQLDHASSGSLKFGGTSEITLGGSDLPNFMVAYGAVGYDFPITKSIYLTPDLRVGALFSMPLIIEVDALLNVAYSF